MNRSRLIRISIASLFGLVFAALIAAWTISLDQQAQNTARSVGFTAGVNIGGPYTLIDHTGAATTEARFAGQYQLIYFGFTFCPDFCPTELQVFARTLDLLGDQSSNVQPLFITIDPARDTVSQLAQYVGLFHPRLVGLTGSEAQVAQAAKAYKVFFAKAPGSDSENYVMDHSTFSYLMGPDGRLITVFPHGTSAEDMARTIRNAMKAAVP